MATASNSSPAGIRAQVLQGVLSSLSGPNKHAGQLAPEQVQKISDKLADLVAEEGFNGKEGELVNEDGLPIIDISEPLSGAESSRMSETPALIEEDDLVPLATLSPAERERQRIERERILDILEEEEMVGQEREKDTQVEHRRRASKEAAKAEVENMKAAREMQKRMGKALIRNMSEAREREEKAQREMVKKDNEKKVVKPKKSVSFAKLPEGGDGEPKDRRMVREKEINIGDVTLGRLRHRETMKMEVIERKSGLAKANEGDSDDESLPDGTASEDSHDGEIINGMPTNANDDPVLESEYDLDTARHHREIAVEYYKQRDAIAREASSIMTLPEYNGDDWDQPEVPLEATLSAPCPKPSVSRFKASRLENPSVVPGSTIRRAIRTGKLENGKLVDSNLRSDDEDGDENVREVIELLKNGNIQNIGPLPDTSIGPTASGVPIPEATSKPKMEPSKFKLARTERSYSPSGSGITPISDVQRSSPRVSSSQNRIGFTANTKAQAPISSSRPPASLVDSPSFPPQPNMIITSPSFQPPPSRPQQPPTVMSPSVSERKATVNQNKTDLKRDCEERKVSRFLAERM